MLKLLRTTALAVATAATGIVTAPERAEAQSYQIDCAILLCLSGGWPASVPCARARAEFIRRITPWPIEPPLQIWRCPMGAAFEVDPSTLKPDRIYDILMDDASPQQSFPTQPLTDFDMEPQPAFSERAAVLKCLPTPACCLFNNSQTAPQTSTSVAQNSTSYALSRSGMFGTTAM